MNANTRTRAPGLTHQITAAYQRMATSRESISSIGWSGRSGFHGEDLPSLSLARYEHINRLGKYTFPSQVEVEPNKLRRLRKPLETV